MPPKRNPTRTTPSRTTLSRPRLSFFGHPGYDMIPLSNRNTDAAGRRLLRMAKIQRQHISRGPTDIDYLTKPRIRDDCRYLPECARQITDLFSLIVLRRVD